MSRPSDGLVSDPNHGGDKGLADSAALGHSPDVAESASLSPRDRPEPWLDACPVRLDMIVGGMMASRRLILQEAA
jgi:hypothetical protein